jgi:hypothetical protein
MFIRERALEHLALFQTTVLRLVATAAIAGVRVASRLGVVRTRAG